MKKLIRQLQTSLTQLQQRYFDLASLQFRLTLEIGLLFVVCSGCVALWTSWKMQQLLITTHKQKVEYIAARFPRDVELYSEMLPVETGLQKTINSLSAPGLLIWVKNQQGALLAQSTNLPATKSDRLMSLAEMPAEPQVHQIEDRYFVLAGCPVTVRPQLVGRVYLAQDVTTDREQLVAAVRGLLAVSALALLLTIAALTYRIRRSLKPLAEMSQIAGAISVEELSAAMLPLDRAPSEVKELAQTFNKMLSRLSDAWEQQRQFVGNVSHELRTPLTVVHGYLQSLLRRSSNLSDFQKEALETAAAEADRTVRMLQDLLDLARADSGHLHFRQELVSVKALIEEVAAMTQRFSNRPIHVAVDSDLVVLADLDRLKQVLINLVDNAVKYSAPDQLIDLTAEPFEQQALIHVGDYGVGIPLQHQNRIFERFYRVDETMSCSIDGTGLGLAIAKSLIEGMAGQISVRSRPGAGSVFTIALPRWDAN
jgi:heavy metal sensor kinase